LTIDRAGESENPPVGRAGAKSAKALASSQRSWT
jgi:hypothetical protein